MKLALAGDTMLGREVGAAIRARGVEGLFAPEVVEMAHEADAFVLNLECAVSARGAPWPEVGKPFFFRAPPEAVEALALLGVDCVTLANNHTLDYGYEALQDTFGHLRAAGISWVGAGEDLAAARSPVVLERGGTRLGVIGVTDHPRSYAAGADHPGVAYTDWDDGVPEWLAAAVGRLDADVVVVSPHWGPNMTTRPSPPMRAAAAGMRRAGATLVAGHSAHVFHGVGDAVLYDLGDFIDDYATEPRLRNDLGLLFLVTFDGPRVRRIEAAPLALDYCHTRLATGADAAWVHRRLRAACAELGTGVSVVGDRLVIESATGPS